jgi:predicted transcriptional regulator
MVMLRIANDPHARMTDIAAAVNITERAAQRIVAELVQAGCIERTREGRRNSYTLGTERSVAVSSDNVIELGSLLAPA